MPNEDKNIGDSLVLDLRIWWRHVKTLYTLNRVFNWQLKKRTSLHTVHDLNDYQVINGTGNFDVQ